MPDFFDSANVVFSCSNTGVLNGPFYAEVSTPEGSIFGEGSFQVLSQYVEEVMDRYKVTLIKKGSLKFSWISEGDAKIGVSHAFIQAGLKLGEGFFPYKIRGKL